MDEDCCAGKKQMACADGYRLENTGNVCYEDDCTTAYEYHCIACDPASDCDVCFDEDGEDYGCEDNVGLLILIICLPIGVVLICICIGCCICHRRRQAQQRQAQAAANAQMAHVQNSPRHPTTPQMASSKCRYTPNVQGAIAGRAGRRSCRAPLFQQPVLEGVVVQARPRRPPAEEQPAAGG